MRYLWMISLSGIICYLFLSCQATQPATQNISLEISIEPIEIEKLGGIQSYAFAQKNGKWLIVGGRLDGLHRRQPWASFDLAGHHNQLLVIDPVNKKKWQTDMQSLPLSIQEQLSATNMEFYQEGKFLYCIGGYGYSTTSNDHITFDKLTAIDVGEVIDGVMNGADISPYFRQIENPLFQVTGGRLEKIGANFYLMGGQKFMGRYNPRGPNFGPGFIQEYTNSIHVFSLKDDGENLSVELLKSFTDQANLHRRDYNAVPQIFPNGEEGVTMFSGVFQHDEDLPFLNSVNVLKDSYQVNNAFTQYLNHYHCPVFPMYDTDKNEMSTLFFGGIAQYYYKENGEVVQDNNVPFVPTIALVSRDKNGEMTEYKLNEEMPALLGAGAEFIPNEDLIYYPNGVLKINELPSGNIHLGYIFGGIESSDKNIFFQNNGNESRASATIYKVVWVR